MTIKVNTNTFGGNIINNGLVPTSKTRHSINPATGESLYEVPISTKEDVDTAVHYARLAFKTWSKTTFEERGKLLLAYADAIEANRDELEVLLVKEQGKPLSLAHTEFDMTLGWLRAFSSMRIDEEVLDENDERTVYQTFPPLGVCCGIVPWNWPILLGLGKVGPALLTGNTMIIKPSPFTPYCDLKLGEIGMSIFPPGVLQVLSGGDDLGPMLTEHPDIDKISFTGSIATGKRVMESCAKTLKRVTLELGGNDPAIICEDVNIEKIIPKIATLAFMNSGQICMLIKRLYVHEAIYEKFRDALVDFTKTIKTGNGLEPDIMVGPLQNSMQYDKVKDLYSEIGKCSWKTAFGGEIDETSKGFFITPAIIDNPPEDSRIVAEEPFGPIIPILKWSDEDDVLERANRGKTGLGASVWSKDLVRAERMARELSAGSVWVNSHFDVAPNVPFGGHKWSGIGIREKHLAKTQIHYDLGIDTLPDGSGVYLGFDFKYSRLSHDRKKVIFDVENFPERWKSITCRKMRKVLQENNLEAPSHIVQIRHDINDTPVPGLCMNYDKLELSCDWRALYTAFLREAGLLESLQAAWIESQQDWIRQLGEMMAAPHKDKAGKVIDAFSEFRSHLEEFQKIARRARIRNQYMELNGTEWDIIRDWDLSEECKIMDRLDDKRRYASMECFSDDDDAFSDTQEEEDSDDEGWETDYTDMEA
ncbi:putative aldehyde dehydrogenase [Phlyctema vagabunda]|uniref:aldehyde dehydrogenase (NAD(+)) n=1 Tax=Phlyctema vagabunda TaxID=108571 RepID=A0ABR4PF13_9HELO